MPLRIYLLIDALGQGNGMSGKVSNDRWDYGKTDAH